MAVKGLTIVSEAILSLGIILVSIAFALVAGQVVDLQAQSLFSSTETGFADRLSGRVGQLADTNATYTTTFEPEIDTYTVRSEGKSTLTVDLPQTESEEIGFLSVNVESPRISDAEQICVSRTGDNVSLSSGPCSSDVFSDFCEDGDCINDICQPERGETCSNSGGDCRCPDDATTETASGECLPDYKAGDYIDEEGAGDGQTDSTEPIGCVQQRFVGAQEQGERCAQDFECGGDLQCQNSRSGEEKRCCPDGMEYSTSEGQCVESNDYKIVFVPLNTKKPVFEDVAQEHGDFFKSSYPLQSCSDRVEIVKLDTACDVSVDTNSCTTSNRLQTPSDINSCLQNRGIEDYEFAVGVFQNDICGSTGGWSLPNDGLDIVTVENSPSRGITPYVTSHEIGHEYGLNDEYLDACRYPSIGGAVDPVNSNCLRQSFDGDEGITPEFDKYCAGGSATAPEYRAFCLGNRNSAGGRDIMSFIGSALSPREFAQPSYEHLSSIGELQCD